MDKNAESGGCAGVQAHLLITCRSLANPLLMLLLSVSLQSLFFLAYRKTTVKCSLTQKCQGRSLHLAAVVYNALWSRLIRMCDTSQLFLLCLLGDLNNKENHLLKVLLVSPFPPFHISAWGTSPSSCNVSLFEAGEAWGGFLIRVRLSRLGYVRSRGFVFSSRCARVHMIANDCVCPHVWQVSAFPPVLLWSPTGVDMRGGNLLSMRSCGHSGSHNESSSF